MAQAILDLHANAEYAAALEEGELPTTPWIGIETDNVHIAHATHSEMERHRQHAMLRGACPVTNCEYHAERRFRMMQHIESHYSLCICSCDYFSSYGDTPIKHGRTRQHEEKPAVMQVDGAHWYVAHRFIASLLKMAPTLPAKP